MGKKKKIQQQWLLRGGAGASLAGLGLCVTIEAGFMKHGDAMWYEWVLIGTVGLALFMSGISLLIDAVRYRIKMDK